MYRRPRRLPTSIHFNCICHWEMKIVNHNPALFCYITAHQNLFAKNYLGWVIDYLLMTVLPDQSMQFILIGSMAVFGADQVIMVKIMVSDGSASGLPAISFKGR